MIEKVLIVGGVAGGASAAARLRRLDENAHIIVFEKGEFISYANCGLPYYIGEVIKDKDDLLVQTPESMHDRFNLDVRVFSEVVSIDRENKSVTVKNHTTGETYDETYDKLVLSPGAEPVRPKMDGIDLPAVFTLRNIPDTYAIKGFVDGNKPRRALVVGGGYIGLEMMENLRGLGIDVTLVEFLSQVLQPVDYEIAAFLHRHIRKNGVDLRLSTGLKAIKTSEDGALVADLTDGKSVPTDMVIMAIGVRPDVKLAKEAGLEIGVRGGISVDSQMRTSDPDIYAVGDAVEVTDFVTGQQTLIPLAGPANKQGRIAAENIAGRKSHFDGTQGAAILKVFALTAAAVGANEKTLKRAGIPYEKIYVSPLNHASYYPGGYQMTLKLIFEPGTGKILGAQAVGKQGIDKRIDVIATAQRLGATVFDLEKLELCYAPPYSSAKDPVNMAGFAAANFIRGDMDIFQVEDIAGLDLDKVQLVDIRTEEEFQKGSISGAVNIPVDNLRERVGELSKDKPIYEFCQVGLRGHVASMLLRNLGFKKVYNLTGGYRLYDAVMDDKNA